MNRSIFFTSLLLMGISLQAQSADSASGTGKALHDANCQRCHDTKVYTRSNRRVTSLEALRKQIHRCELSLELRWFEDQLDEVVDYLNNEYYGFK